VNGFDFNYVLDQSSIDPDGLTLAAEVSEPVSGRFLEVWTNQPGIQFYTGNSIREGGIGKSAASYGRWGGLCLETQHFPDTPNHPDFPSTLVNPENPYHRVCEYRFGIRK
jgi:aldose 1-epimerase